MTASLRNASSAKRDHFSLSLRSSAGETSWSPDFNTRALPDKALMTDFMEDCTKETSGVRSPLSSSVEDDMTKIGLEHTKMKEEGLGQKLR
jgi:hypothetical protein